MSDEQKKDQTLEAGDQTAPVGHDSNAEQTSQDSVNVDGLSKKNQELLNEKKKLQAKLAKFEKEQEEKERKKMEEEGKYKELLESYEKEKAALLEEKNELIKKETIKDAVLGEKIDLKWLDFVEGKFEFDDEMNITNRDEIFATFKEQFPEAYAQPARPQTTAGFPAKTNQRTIPPEKLFHELTGDDFEKNADALIAEIARGL